MALPSETSDTRQQFTWSHCYDMSLTVLLLAMPVWRARPAGVPDGPVPVSAHAPE